MENKIKYLTTVSPHLHEGSRTASIMWMVSLCLAPASLWSVYVFGMSSLIVLLVSIFSSVLTEFVITKLLKKFTLMDGSAFLTGLLIGFNMPPSIPLYIPMLASIFAIAVVKHTFGGLGANWMNPALAGRVFVMFSFSGPMSSWLLPRTLWHTVQNAAVDAVSAATPDAVSAATPLGTVKSGLQEVAVSFSNSAEGVVQRLQELKGPMHYLASGGYPVSQFDAGITGWLNNTFGLSIQPGYFDLFMGNVGGCIGEVSVLLLLLGTIYLFVKKIITWEIPVSYLACFSLLVWVFGGMRFAGGLFTGDVLFHLLTGGLVLGAFYMATDMVTTPLTSKGMIIFGVGAGLLTFLIRFFGSLPEGVSLAIIIMNIAVPLIDRYTKPPIFGTKKEDIKNAKAT
jgi:electron transport complex protein RnfD